MWTSGGQIADMGMLLARTNPDVPKHQGITYFAFDMRQPGVEVRPLREMTGRALFNEVFLTEARVGGDAIIGGLNNGWAVANTTLTFERAGLGAGGSAARCGGTAVPGSIAGDLDKRAGDLVAVPGPGRRRRSRRARRALRPATDPGPPASGSTDDPLVRQQLARLHTLTEIGRYHDAAPKGPPSQGGDIPGAGNLAKLSMSNILRLSRDLGLQLLGPRGTLHGYTAGTTPPWPTCPPGPWGPWSPRWPSLARVRPSTGAPTRSSTTSSASGSSACPRNPTTTR